MTPAAAKLLMCVCAGSTGAAIVPVASRVHKAMKPRPAIDRTVAAPAPAVSQATERSGAPSGLPCLPYAEGVTGAGLGGDAPLTLGNLSPATEFAATGFSSPAAPHNNFGSSGGYLGTGGSGLPGTGPLPATNAVPEPATWAMMIAGVGVVGGALRWRRQETAAA